MGGIIVTIMAKSYLLLEVILTFLVIAEKYFLQAKHSHS